MNAQEVIKTLRLESHIEGGYYRRTFQSDDQSMLRTDDGDRFLMTSIFYLLTVPSPIGHWHRNESDIMHCYHLGGSLRYHLLRPDGAYETHVLGANIAAGEMLQLVVKGGVWKASELLPGPCDFGLISEAVSPGFDMRDMSIGNLDMLLDRFPDHEGVIRRFVKV